MSQDKTTLGPIDYVIIGFDGDTFNSTILQELQHLTTSGLIHIIDLLFVSKDDQGRIEGYELKDMPAEVQATAKAARLDAHEVLGPADVKQIGDEMHNNMSAAILVFEHLWAKGFKQAIQKANGKLLGEGRIHPDTINEATAEASK